MEVTDNAQVLYLRPMDGAHCWSRGMSISPSITAVSLNPDPCGPECAWFWGMMHHCLKEKEEGIPFYLPKPLLIVAKNFRNLEEAKVGLTGRRTRSRTISMTRQSTRT